MSSNDFVTRSELDGATDGLRVEIKSGDELVTVKLDGFSALIDEKFRSMKLWFSLALLAGSTVGTVAAANIASPGSFSGVGAALHHLL